MYLKKTQKKLFVLFSSAHVIVLLAYLHSPKGLLGTPVQFLINAII